jgi:hypothetical protein
LKQFASEVAPFFILRRRSACQWMQIEITSAEWGIRALFVLLRFRLILDEAVQSDKSAKQNLRSFEPNSQEESIAAE